VKTVLKSPHARSLRPLKHKELYKQPLSCNFASFGNSEDIETSSLVLRLSMESPSIQIINYARRLSQVLST